MTVELVGGPHCGKVFEVKGDKYRLVLPHGSKESGHRHAIYWRGSPEPHAGRQVFFYEGIPFRGIGV